MGNVYWLYVVDHHTLRYIPVVIETNLSKNDIVIYHDIIEYNYHKDTGGN